MIISKRVMKYISIIITAAAVVALMFAVKRPAAADDPHQNHEVCVGSACTDPNHTVVGWTEWTGTTTLPTSGTYYLSGNVNLSSTITLTGDLTLCLNGHEISGSTTKFIVPVSKTLNICDCSTGENGKLTGATEGSAVVVQGNNTVNNGATFNLYSGKISDSNIAGAGGGVRVEYIGTFNMYGGKISNNTVSSSSAGGGVYVKGNTGDARSTFNMYGGTISDNKAKNGGGVYVQSTDFTMYGGTISNNTSDHVSYSIFSNYGGGGVFVGENATFIMDGEDSKVVNNHAKNTGGGVHMGTNGKLKLKRGTISNNDAICGGGVFNFSYGAMTFEMSGGTISDNTATESGGGVYNSNTFTMSGGTILENEAESGNGGGVYNNSTFTMIGGTISENKAENGNGGGVYNHGTFTMEKDNDTGTVGTISGNITKNGGGVYVDDYGYCKFMMSDGTISGNEATENGGGVYSTGEYTNQYDPDTTACKFKMEGGTITENKTGGNGGGVFVDSLFMVNGAVNITENLKTAETVDGTDTDNNVYLPNSKTITIGGNFDKDDSTIGVTVEAPPNNCQNVVQVTTGGTIGDEVGFRSDEEDCDVEDNENVVDVQLIGQHRWNDGTIATAPTCMAVGSKEVTCTLCSTNATLTMDIVDHNWDTEWYKDDETEHWHFCTYECGTKNDVAVHNWDGGVETTPATTDTEGVMTFTCTVCTRTKTELIPKLSEGGNNPGNNNPSSRPSNNNSSGSVPSQSENPSTSEINTSSGDNSNPSESSPTANNGNPSTGITVSILPLTLTATALTVASKRKNLKK